MDTKAFDFSSRNYDFLPQNDQIWPKNATLVNLGQAMQAYSMTCCESDSGCGARAVSRKTPIYFIEDDVMATLSKRIEPGCANQGKNVIVELNRWLHCLQ